MAEISLNEENPFEKPLPFLKARGSMMVFNKKNFPLKVGMVINLQNIDMVVNYVNIGQNFVNLECKNIPNFEIGSKHMFKGVEYEVIKINGNKVTIKNI